MYFLSVPTSKVLMNLLVSSMGGASDLPMSSVGDAHGSADESCGKSSRIC